MQGVENHPPEIQDTESVLGSLVFSGRQSKAETIAILFGGLLFLSLAGLAVVYPGFVSHKVVGSLTVFGIVCSVLGAVMFWREGTTVWNLHERGAVAVRRGRSNLMLYEDVDELTFKTTRLFVKGSYSGTTQEVTLRSYTPGREPIEFQHQYHEKTGVATDFNETNEIHGVCDHIAALLAERMARQLEQGQAVAWGDRVTLHPWGIEIAKRMWAASQQIEWDRLDRLNLEEGVLRLWAKDESKPCLQLKAEEKNFFPGYRLVAAQVMSNDKPLTARPAAPKEAQILVAPSDRRETIVLAYANDSSDYVALNQHGNETTPRGRRIRRGQMAMLSLLFLAFGLTVCHAKFHSGQIAGPALPFALATVAAGVPLLVMLMAYLQRVRDRFVIENELKAAHESALKGVGQDPFAHREVVLEASGYRAHTSQGEWHLDWQRVSRIEWFQNRIFVFVAGDKVSRETFGLIIPPAAFAESDQARQIYETIRGWHAAVQEG